MSLAGLIAAILLVTSSAPLAVASERDVARATPVDVVYSTFSTEGADPATIAIELEGLLRHEGGLTNVRLDAAPSAADLLARVRSSEAAVLVVLGHGEAAGLHAGDRVVPWPELREALAASGATYVAIGACDSARLGGVPGKIVVTTFEGLADARVIAPQIASDLFLGPLVLLDDEFLPEFELYIDAQGGLEAYARWIAMPERPMQSSGCEDLLTEWYDGNDTASKGRCIFYLHPHNLNCYSDADHATKACTSSSAAEQESLNRGAVASGTAYDGDAEGVEGDEFSGTWWKRFNAVYNAVITPGENVTVTSGPSGCFTIVRFEDVAVGGLSFAIRPFFTKLKDLFRNKANAPVDADADAALLALRGCGSLEARVSLPATNAEARIEAAGDVDIRVSTYFEAEVKVFRWNVGVSFEGGVMFPASFGISGKLALCPGANEPDMFAARLDVPFDFGGAAFFAEAQAGWTSMGGKWDLGGKRGGSLQKEWSCPSGWVPSAASVGIDPDLDALDPTLARLVGLGIARVNAAPTVIAQDETSKSTIGHAFLTLEPGTMAWQGYADRGVLAALGISDELGADQKVILDATDASILAKLGRNVTDAPVPRVSLVNGIAVVPRSLPTSSAEELYCNEDVEDPLKVLHAKACVGYSSTPLPSAHGSLGAMLRGPAVTVPYVETAEVRDQINAQVNATCAAAGVETTACARARHDLASASAALGGIDLLASIHDAFEILQRPTHAQWLLSACALNVGETSFDTGPVPMVTPDGRPTLGNVHMTSCLRWSETTDLPYLDARAVVAEYLEGQALLAFYTTHVNDRFAAAQSADGGELPPDLSPYLRPIYDVLEDYP